MKFYSAAIKLRSALSLPKIPPLVIQIFSILIPLLLLVGTPIVMQYVHYDGSESIFWWLEHFTGAYFCNLIIITLVTLLIYPLFNSLYFSSGAVFVCCMLLSCADFHKMRILNQPLLPVDIFYLKQALVVGKMYILPAALSGILLLMFGGLYWLFARRVRHYAIPMLPRIILLLVMVIVTFLSVSQYQKLTTYGTTRFSLVNEFWDQRSNYLKNGVLCGFAMNLTSLPLPKPAGYSNESIENIFSQIPQSVSGPQCSDTIVPDVIVYLSESFWDITTCLSLPLQCDPIPHFHALSLQWPLIQLVSPVFGGTTCNAEFELLTALPHRYFPSGVMAYNQFIHNPLPSMVSIFKQNGYRTTSIHTFKRWFWNRVNVYRHLGFDKFLSQETMKNPEKKGKFISDRELAQQIIVQAQTTGAPDFIFALSMQNHGPYELPRYDSLECQTTTELSDKAEQELNCFLQGLIDADRSLATITHYIDTVATPTMLFFFGDHLPGFSHLYREAGVESRLHDTSRWAHTTSGILYANYPLKPESDSLLNMFYLPLVITSQSGITPPAYYRYLDRVRSQFPVLETDTGNKILCTVNRSLRSIVYDQLFGERYSSPSFQLLP